MGYKKGDVRVSRHPHSEQQYQKASGSGSMLFLCMPWTVLLGAISTAAHERASAKCCFKLDM